MKHVRYILLAWMAVLFVACGDEENRFSNYHCNLTIDNSLHQNLTLASAMDANASGTFCVITITLHGGYKYFAFTNNRGTYSESIFKAIDDRLKSQEHVGQNGRLIVGYGNMDNPAQFYAYDGECPNCFDLNALPLRSYPLTIDSQGLATCAACHRQYRLNMEGMVVGGTGRHLEMYRATSSAAYGVLHVY